MDDDPIAAVDANDLRGWMRREPKKQREEIETERRESKQDRARKKREREVTWERRLPLVSSSRLLLPLAHPTANCEKENRKLPSDRGKRQTSRKRSRKSCERDKEKENREKTRER
jgi:hypothetical protein